MAEATPQVRSTHSTDPRFSARLYQYVRQKLTFGEVLGADANRSRRGSGGGNGLAPTGKN